MLYVMLVLELPRHIDARCPPAGGTLQVLSAGDGRQEEDQHNGGA